MSNGEVCCILGVCCPPNSAKQKKALEKFLETHKDDPAGALLETFDLAPAGTLDELKGGIAKMARGTRAPEED